MLYRDLKPANVLIADGFVSKVADFGESRRFDERGEDGAATMTACGTRRYAAPEIILLQLIAHTSWNLSRMARARR